MINKSPNNRMKIKPFGVSILFFIGLFMLTIPGYVYYDESKENQVFSSFGVKTMAKVIEHQENKNRYNRRGSLKETKCDVRYEFFINNQTYIGNDRYYDFCKEEIGDNVEIIYNSKDYSKNRFVNHESSFRGMVVFLAISISFILLSVYSLIYLYLGKSKISNIDGQTS